MVGALYSNPWLNTAFFQRVRPGYVLSGLLHAVLLVILVYILANRSDQPPPADDSIDNAQLVQYPPQPKTAPPIPKFQPAETPPLSRVVTTVPPLPLPPVVDLKRAPEILVSVEPPAPPVIVNPSPISRGGLVYPWRAREADLNGYVDFDFTIGADGSVQNPVMLAEVPRGYGFATAAMAFTGWKFMPRTIGGKAVPAAARIRVTFTLK